MPHVKRKVSASSPRRAVGIDLVCIADVAHSVTTFGNRYLNRLYTTDEIRYCLDSGGPAVAAGRLAARFAAKEAVFKALRWGNRPTDWRSVEIRRSRYGWCTVRLHGEARRVADRAGLTGFDVSMAHEGEYATAVVTALRGT
jgi:holo-[acyl-carrier protein] synthase